MTPVMATTIPGTKLDGTRAACYSYTMAQQMVSEEAENLDWGAYTLVIQGYANAQAMQPSHCGRFRVFIGPGPRTQVWSLTVPKAGAVDAGAPCP